MRRIYRQIIPFTCNLIILATMPGCSGVDAIIAAPPSKLYDDESALTSPTDTIGLASLPNYIKSTNTPSEARNEFIAMRMYSIDIEYSKYETKLTAESESTDLAGSLINLGLTGTASVIPVGEVTKVLSAAAAGVTGATGAVDKNLLLSQTIQNLEIQMRTDRNTQAAKILSSMQCSVTVYPIGLALSDLEEYYRSGTLSSALVGISKTVSAAEADAKGRKDAASPSSTISDQGSMQLKAAAASTNAAAGAAAATTQSCKS